MNSKLILISTKNMPEQQWLQQRQNGIGGSEIGTLMCLNPYESQLELYHRKIGAAPLQKFGNEAMHWGHQHESTIARNWQYYDGTIDGMIERSEKGKEFIFRKCRNYNYIVKNPAYPALLGNVDRLINKNQVRIFDGGILETEGLLEIKTVRDYAMKQWEAEVPPQYVLQIMSYLGICELEYAELAVLKDGSKLDIIPFPFSKSIFENILDAAIPFWDRIQKGRMLMGELRAAQSTGDQNFIEDMQALLDENEPIPTIADAESRNKYLNKRFSVVDQVIKGNDEIFDTCQKYRQCTQEINLITKNKDFYASLIKNYMKGSNILDFGMEGGCVTWKENKNGDRSLNVNKLL